jgi:hypothetical protein
MRDLEWIKSLVDAELKMEENGTIENVPPFDPAQTMQTATLNFLNSARDGFVDYITAFNQMRGQPVGGIKIYGISRTEADFMLFRNGFKLMFSAIEPGKVSVRFQNPSAVGQDPLGAAFDEDQLTAQWGAFGEIKWVFDQLEIKREHLVRYYLERFIRESAQ